MALHHTIISTALLLLLMAAALLLQLFTSFSLTLFSTGMDMALHQTIIAVHGGCY
jgi:hypothetical protein